MTTNKSPDGVDNTLPMTENPEPDVDEKVSRLLDEYPALIDKGIPEQVQCDVKEKLATLGDGIPNIDPRWHPGARAGARAAFQMPMSGLHFEPGIPMSQPPSVPDMHLCISTPDSKTYELQLIWLGGFRVINENSSHDCFRRLEQEFHKWIVYLENQYILRSPPAPYRMTFKLNKDPLEGGYPYETSSTAVGASVSVEIQEPIPADVLKKE